ncbi:DNA repair protein RecO [Anaerosacchariphilus sp. NSJ-68]|uniref:DNA repair protein RecO n=2 Tax=Lachnospiraceae TaxID=186803 RepID=A0A923LB78_9FIRM|nr:MULTISPECIES: DNA repair protein RecO [Lachnospiraceae]MBC5659376.1 DNA repair protein RecO [Anaerosacchariphilus hominis]MBC5697042.1 DNA repair protein RecO [Roseburia difficilis]
MGQMITVTGLVLAAYPQGDYDKRLVLLTKERGKITAFARGARRQNSPLLAVCNSFVFGEFTVYEGRTSFNLMQARAGNYFHELSADFEGACYGFYFCEVAEYYTREANDELQMLKLLYQSLRALVSPRIPDELIRYIYELKVLVVNGECPPDFETLDICQSTLYTLQYIAASPVEKLYTFQVSEEVLGELRFVMNRYRQQYMEGHYRSREILEACVGLPGASGS